MLVNVPHDRNFQSYLDQMEQRLHLRKFPILMGAIRLQMSRGSIPAQAYIRERGEPVLLRHYQRIYHDVYDSIVYRDQKAARTGRTGFMQAQLSYLERRAATRLADVSQRVTEEVRQIVLRGVREGKSNDRIADELYEDLPDLSRGRAARIARTETHSAAMAAMHETIQHQGLVIKSKTWVTAHDNRVRSSHVPLNGVTIPFDQPFEAEGGLMMFPGDDSLGAGAEERVNCRCAVLYNT
jgi:hypothetical protein